MNELEMFNFMFFEKLLSISDDSEILQTFEIIISFLMKLALTNFLI